jgi:hypothetical protein
MIKSGLIKSPKILFYIRRHELKFLYTIISMILQVMGNIIIQLKKFNRFNCLDESPIYTIWDIGVKLAGFKQKNKCFLFFKTH